MPEARHGPGLWGRCGGRGRPAQHLPTSTLCSTGRRWAAGPLGPHGLALVAGSLGSPGCSSVRPAQGTDTLESLGASVTNPETAFQLFPVETGGWLLPTATPEGQLQGALPAPNHPAHVTTAGVSVTSASCLQTPAVAETHHPHPTQDPFFPEAPEHGIPF